MMLKNKKILLIVGGGVSAYKVLDFIRLLKKQGVKIKTIITKSGKNFITPLSVISLSKGKVYEDIFDSKDEAAIDHISLSRWADLVLVIPATANFMAKLLAGKADDLATTVSSFSLKGLVF